MKVSALFRPKDSFFVVFGCWSEVKITSRIRRLQRLFPY
uniref:Uncharacterized protein n=1 Tax=Anopheles dirus TaxID=7168 RepID=A0A2Y9D1L9_9DIPT